MGGFAIDNVDNELAWIAILRVESCLVLVLGSMMENDGNKSMMVQLEGVSDGNLEWW